ncbi:tetratricopeptide repeat protein [Panacibacter ginsenosidivorans]|uniref:Tetratricopeptide repeat protein n=1 Tax=Panacibacter ginsenosidivorans TaxID=1813871 RepID=A0A5B8VCV3_9BACT|nr:tetratricopeptide repeat protein [Panacibacter ginsenosidivorans]QEC68781.1 tetratricopeptide repeat protein [Panacibacter ginsenosidivorans]
MAFKKNHIEKVYSLRLLHKASNDEVSDTTGDAFDYSSLLLKKYFTALLFMVLCNFQIVAAQKTNLIIKSGNEAYKKGDYKSAEKLYKEALTEDKNNLAAKFNLGNALLKQHNIAEAVQYFTQVSEAASDDAFKSKAFYNKGLTMVKAQQLPEAIDAFKQSLLLAPDDNDTRENLQKAIEELKKQQHSQPPPQQNQQKKPDPKKQQNKIPNKDVMEQKFDELSDKEKQLQKLLQKKSTTDQPEKDW